MTNKDNGDLEISKALALAIGWPREDVIITAGQCLVDTHDLRNKVKVNSYWMHGCRVLDYKDWRVAGPVAERHNCFPREIDRQNGRWECVGPDGEWYYADTPQKAIALAVIQGTKK